ncbi:MAG: hypothetical protein LUE29_00820 [Lachnospiraceae bacterium]|nr:hypothetical protein [Lachnospiraceae bacterium]
MSSKKRGLKKNETNTNAKRDRRLRFDRNQTPVLYHEATKQLQEHVIASETDTDERLQVYYRKLAREGEKKDAELDEQERKERTELHEALAEESEDLKGKAEMLARASFRSLEQADELESRLSDVKNSQKKRRFIPPAPANTIIDFKEQESGHFASGMNFYKIYLVFFIGSFGGVVVEMLWCLLKNGYIASRAGVVYGPFNPLYGAGALLLSMVLYKYRNRSWIFSFIGGFLVGSALEYVVSWGQETLFGSRSWDYSAMPFNINGRICLLYSIFWGILGVWWIKSIYPRMAEWILKIPNKVGKILTWILLVFMIFDGAISLIAVGRWSARISGQEAASAFEEFIDERFPDERMERIYENMEFGEM